ncbi:Killer toxin subunits alpha/beta-like protein [Hapsidospora chrysogenum ATCC 11550]|uniref:chitinase n=1 Tax=Hapsidospora chrysogenum (strain ATCC 11550 / CBS 779.69 / DSM 880 / IAM 14645 / JCM 23072 / IMI 49137) TaxID=857340 RepID=A0A086SUJ9_HAPC1|nr:Killer toxin subunits alpha/beta-like protein [Hapsidospora chrysogenum ATCC 11550]
MHHLTRLASLACVAVNTAWAGGRGNSIYFSGEAPCPGLCDDVGPDPANWTVYHSVDRLGYCDMPLVLSFAIYNRLDDPETGKTIGACTVTTSLAYDENNKRSAPPNFRETRSKPQSVRRKSDNNNNNNNNDNEDAEPQLKHTLQAAWKNSSIESTGDIDLVSQAGQLKSFLNSPNVQSTDQGPTLYFLYRPDVSTTLGIYAGSGVSASPLLDTFNDVVESNGHPGHVLIQACQSPSDDTAAAVGVVASSGSDSLVAAQLAVSRWANSTCVSTEGFESETLSTGVTTANIGTVGSASDHESRDATVQHLDPRANCRTVKVKQGDLCADVASRCGITVAKLKEFNPKKNFCTTLKVPQLVCCSKGDLPRPKPDSKGNCATYKVKSGSSCWGITEKYSGLITEKDLESWNKKTWGWGGCGNLQLNNVICISSGKPPLPASVKDTECGPIKPGTKAPPDGTDLAKLNPCPLNACCSVHGYCGTTAEFCRPLPKGSAPGAPQKPGGPTCISGCGMDVVNNKNPPKEFVKIGYFEGYGISRPCDRVSIGTIDTSKYTHIHFAFATVTSDDYEVDMGPTINQFSQFKKMKGVKKILSFGGWAFSTEPETYQVFRNGVRSENRAKMAQNIANFIKDNGLDGVDIDWEYPAAPDLPGIPMADPDEGDDYLKFLTKLRNILPKDKYSVSFAAPASFWYLKGFPVKKIIDVVDYVIYMTYDLHGQWDYGNQWATPGCPTGNCLRSHVNMTETLNALAMITKAGAPSNKVVVGVTSYGRSFKMTKAGCTGPMCKFVGPDSGARKGRCTGTAGYLAMSEIRDIIATNSNIKTFTDKSESTILVYNNTEWVAYMSDDEKAKRTKKYKDLNFMGTTDWAVTLDMKGLVEQDPVDIGDDNDFLWPQDAVNPQIHKSCTAAHKKKILEAWNEAGEVTTTAWQWTRWNKYQKALDTYIGKKSGQVPIIGSDHIWANLKKHYYAHNGGWRGGQRGIYSYFYCDVNQMPKKVQDKIQRKACRYFPKKSSGTAAKTWRFPGKLWSEYYVLLCPWWLGDEQGAPEFRSLASLEDEAIGFETLQKQIDLWGKTVRATTIYHETAHWQDISWPHCDGNEMYKPEDIASQAKNRGDEGYEFNLRNAHSWSLTALAMWIMEAFERDSPPMPSKPIPEMPSDWQIDPDDPDSLDEGAWITILDENWFDPARVDPDDFSRLSQVGPGGGGGLGKCVEGREYQYEDQCKKLCIPGDDTKCTKKGDRWKCTGCHKEPTECNAGLHDDWDDCYENCKDGLCSENAGEKGIRCGFCPE